ncbi:MAG: DUF3368 domain-containing protein [Myxococcales bacterium]|nr:DUF3368 domain-containing protein [Myxococcales bacterium]
MLDDRAARQRAKALGIPVLGILRVLVEGKRRGHLDAVGPVLKALVSADYRLGEALIQRTLEEAGEAQ